MRPNLFKKTVEKGEKVVSLPVFFVIFSPLKKLLHCLLFFKDSGVFFPILRETPPKFGTFCCLVFKKGKTFLAFNLVASSLKRKLTFLLENNLFKLVFL